MPLVDMPLAKLMEYRGINPRPDDFDAYWDRALQEMKAVDPQLEWVPSPFQVPFANCYDLYFTGVRGARIHAQYIRPKHVPEPHPAVIRFHGYSGNAGDWNEKLAYAALGYTVVAMDCRGQGGKSEDTGGTVGNTYRGQIIRGLDGHPDHLLFRHIFLDAAQLAGIVMEQPEVDAARVGVFGSSQGGGLTLACASLEPRIKMLAPMIPFLSDYKRVWEMDLAKDAYEELRMYFRLFDPQHEREEETFTKLGYIDIQNLTPRIQGEVMMGLALMDTVCPPSTQMAAYNKIRSPKRLEVYPDYGHEVLPGLHDKIMQFFMKL